MTNPLGFNPQEAHDGQLKELREQIAAMEAERDAERERERKSWLWRNLWSKITSN